MHLSPLPSRSVVPTEAGSPAQHASRSLQGMREQEGSAGATTRGLTREVDDRGDGRGALGGIASSESQARPFARDGAPLSPGSGRCRWDHWPAG